MSEIADLIDLEQAINLTQAAKLLRGRGGKRPHVDTLRRWANPNEGYKLPGGGRAVLKTVRVGQEILTLPEWVEAFERRRATRGLRQEPAAQERTPSRRQAAHKRAERRLDEAGVK